MPHFSDPDIEEDDECCVVRIAPRPIKLKIKPIVKPVDPDQDKDHNVQNGGAESLNSWAKENTATSVAISEITHMHPKKKIAHLDSLNNSYSKNVFTGGVTGEQETGETAVQEKQMERLREAEEKQGAIGGDTAELKETGTPPVRQRPRRLTQGGEVGRRGRDVRTKCDTCSGGGNNSTLVRSLQFSN